MGPGVYNSKRMFFGFTILIIRDLDIKIVKR